MLLLLKATWYTPQPTKSGALSLPYTIYIQHSRPLPPPQPPRRPPRPSYGTKGTTILHTIYIYCCWRSPLVLPQPSFLSFSPQKSMFSTYIGCPEKFGTDLLPYSTYYVLPLYVGISLGSWCTTFRCVGVRMPFRLCYSWDTRNKYYICSNYDLIYMKFCYVSY